MKTVSSSFMVNIWMYLDNSNKRIHPVYISILLRRQKKLLFCGKNSSTLRRYLLWETFGA